MQFIPRSLLIVVKAHNAEAMREAEEISAWLRERGVSSCPLRRIRPPAG